MKKAVLYTSANLDGSWLPITIDIALWLNKNKGFKSISINCIANYNRFHIFSLLLRIKNLRTYLKKSKFNKFINPTNSKISKKTELANFAIGESDQMILSIEDLEIKFNRIRQFKKKNFINSIILIKNVLLDYYKFFRQKSLRKKKYLEYKHKNIYAGLYVLSEALRSDYRSCGSIFKCRLGILNSLYKMYKTSEIIQNITFPQNHTVYVCGPAQNYIYGFFSKYMHVRGAYFIDTSDPKRAFVEREIKGKFFSHLNENYIKYDDVLFDENKIIQYFENRIENPWEAFSYMNNLKKKSIKKNVLNLNYKVTVVLYLHSFTDAQYYYGYDEYHDLMEWSYRTAILLNSNEHVSKVFIKPHPGLDPIHHPGDVIANKYLRKNISKLRKVCFVDFHFDVKNIKSTGLVVGITHHGSVAEELVFKKYPVISSSFAPWGSKYNFGYFWNTKKEYEELISSRLITELKVTPNHLKELYRYANEKYFMQNFADNFNINSSWQDLMKTYGIKIHNEHSLDMKEVDNLVSCLDHRDIKFREYISKRIHRIDALNYYYLKNK